LVHVGRRILDNFHLNIRIFLCELIQDAAIEKSVMGGFPHPESELSGGLG
jgi:hypothetical protein